MTEYSNPAYFIALFLANFGTVWFAWVLWACLRSDRGWLPHHAVAAAAFVLHLSDFYSVLPALWWPDASLHVKDSFESFAFALFVSLGLRAGVLVFRHMRKLVERRQPAKKSAA